MSIESLQFEPWYAKLRLVLLVGVLSLPPCYAFAAEDTARTTQSSPPDSISIESSMESTSVLGDHTNAFDQIVELYATLTRANKNELYELLEDTRDIVLGSVRDEAVFAIASRFAEFDPQEALAKYSELEQHERDSFVKGIFSEWCVSNLDEAIAAAAKLSRNERLTILKVIVKVRDDLTETHVNAIASELGHPYFAAFFESQSKAIEFADNPITAWSALVHDGLDDFSQLDTLVLVAEAIVEKQGFDALFHLNEPLDKGFEIVGEIRIFDEVLRALVKNDPHTALAYIQDGSTRVFNHSLEKDQVQEQHVFSPREQAYMTDKVQHLMVRVWADVYPETVLAEIESLPHKLQPLACEYALGALVTKDPERTVELIRSLSVYGARNDATLREVVRRWSAEDPSAAVDWILSASEMDNVSSNDAFRSPSSKEWIMRTALTSLGLEDPKRALEIAALQEDIKYLQLRIIRAIAQNDIETAIEVLPLVSNNERTNATESVAGAMALNGEVDRGMEFLHQYEESSEEEVSWYWFFRSWAGYSAVDLYDRLDEFEPKLRTAAARALGYIYLPELTQEQQDHIRTIYDWNNPPE